MKENIEIPAKTKNEFFHYKKTFPEASVWYNSCNDTFFVLLFDCWKPKSLLIKRLPEPETPTQIINKNVKIKTLDLCKNHSYKQKIV